MAHAKLQQWVEDSVETLVAMGVDREVAERELHGVKWAAERDIAECRHDDQLLLLFDKYGSAACAERFKVSDRTIRDWRQRAINRKAARRTASA